MSRPTVLFSEILISYHYNRTHPVFTKRIFKEDLLKNHHKLKAYLVYYIVFLSLLDRSALVRQSSEFLSDSLRFIISVIVCRRLKFPGMRRSIHRWQSVGWSFGSALNGQAGKNTLYISLHNSRFAVKYSYPVHVSAI